MNAPESRVDSQPRKSFGEALRVAREKKRISVVEVARAIGRKRSYVEQLEANEVWPDSSAFPRLIGCFPQLSIYRTSRADAGPVSQPPPATAEPSPTEKPSQVLRRWRHTSPFAICSTNPSQFAPPPAPEPENDHAPEPEPEPEPVAEIETDVSEPATFGEMLRAARKREKLTTDELGRLIGVVGSAVCMWETEDTTPILAHYEKLLALFPELPHPASRDMRKPGRGPLWTRDVEVSPFAVAALPPPAPTPRSETAELAEKAPSMPAVAPARTPAPLPPMSMELFLHWHRLLNQAKDSPAAGQFVALLEACKAAGFTLDGVIEALR